MTLNTSSQTHEAALTCPRCRALQTAQRDAASHEAEHSYVECPSCGFAYRLSAFQKQSDRQRQRLAWPDDPKNQRLLSDKPLARTAKQGVTMSFREWVLWKLRHPSTVTRLTLRSGIHQVLFHASRLAEEYPAIPRAISTPAVVQRFWTDPHHRFILDTIWQWMKDTDYIAADLEKTSKLTSAEVRDIIDTELPRSQWGGGPLAITTYMTFALEFRGLLLAIMLINAQYRELPPLFSAILDWLAEEGWDHHGYTRDSAT